MDSVITVVGNLTRDPDLKFTASGAAVCGFAVAVNRVWFDKQTNEKQEAVSFVDVTAWGSLAENLTCLDKGARVIVSGRIEQENWEQDDGQKRSKLKIVADSVGPDLRWATVEVQRNERTEGGGSKPAAKKQAAPRKAPAPAASGYDEEPF